MFICVCQPPETALLLQGGPPIAMGPLNADGFKNRTNAGTITSDNLINKINRKKPKISSPSKLQGISGTLLNLRQIQRKAKCTKILVNPLHSDETFASSDDDTISKTDSVKWNCKSTRLKTGKISSEEGEQDGVSNNIMDVDSKNSKDKNISISCFKMLKSSPDIPSSKKYSKNEVPQISRSSSNEPDIVIVSRSSSADILKSDFANGSIAAALNVITEPLSSNNLQTMPLLGEGVELTVGELRAMALRQQQQIDTQHQLLCAKEQRLRYLKQQEARQHQVALEGERLRRLRERVEAQELKLRRLRALRGQLDRNKQANIALTSDLESIRALFNEKEKELSVAVAKVEELTRQLEELRPGRAQPPPPSAHELDKLRRELMYRNKLNEQQNGRLSAQRAALGARQEEMRSIDRRVSELQARLLRQRALNRQLAAAHRQHPHHRLISPSGVQHLATYGPGSGQPKSQPSRGNIAAVEPYNHVPYSQSGTHTHQALKQNILHNVPIKQLTQSENISAQLIQQEAHYMQQKQMSYSPGFPPPPTVKHEYLHVQQGIGNPYDHKTYLEHLKYQDFTKQPQCSPNSNSSSKNFQHGKESKINDQEFFADFTASKTDPKYQTLPLNTKFPQSSQGKMKVDITKNGESRGDAAVNGPSGNVSHMTVHSTPLSAINKSLATPLEQAEAAAANLDLACKNGQEGKENQSVTNNSKNPQTKSNGQINTNVKSSQNSAIFNHSSVVGSNSSSASSSVSFGKPVSSVAPTSVQVSSGKPSPIYQTSSTKIQPVQPQTLQTQSHATHLISNMVASQPQMVRSPTSSVAFSPPQGASTPLDASAAAADKSPKPALPPKPTVKTPPRQLGNMDVIGNQIKDEIALTEYENPNEVDVQQQKEKDSTNGSTSSSSGSGDMIIKAKPLTIRKPPMSEQPKLRNLNNSKTLVSGNINRRIEMPPAFLFPEIDHISRSSGTKNAIKSKDVAQLKDEVDKALLNNNTITLNSSNNIEEMKESVESETLGEEVNGRDSQEAENVLMRCRKGNLKQGGKAPLARRVSFDPLALLLDASLEGELELVKKTATQVQNASAANDEGITALHNAICAGHIEIVKFLVELGCDVNAQDSDGWTPLHCAASCNNLPMVRFLVDNGACIFATTLSDHETAAEKCEEDEEGFDGCSEFLYSVQEKLGIMNGGVVYGVFAYSAARVDELCFSVGGRLQVLRKGDEFEREWWWCRDQDNQEGYVPRNLLGLYPRVTPRQE